MEKDFFFVYIHDLDTNIRNAIGIKLTHLDYETIILNTGRDTQDLIFSLDKINGNILFWFHKNRLIINKDKPLALD
jgi:hypothetical protein